jgi:hypothetical protein
MRLSALRYGPEGAQDLTQGFFLGLLYCPVLARIDALKGKLRSLSEWHLNP